ncbi:Pkr1p [Lachancea thermotolerans CBS 6340]|uniref:KLTH0E09086p n=1 Tax=Lachancea thermotolerans (strain ATCC 56472 / CBS 6340 / NRRL Y-8284) TaxID=559295 RepID=C5DI22_LACTC|nr:KLTH0E09086p [Lachancea thermotolerans CBS 6340]CAR23433.1 KLTH0E09086p [Lachancea thermotolerans CBS 6340]
MANFFEELWRSIFTPGASPQLIVATHVSFFLLTACLSWLIFWTKNIHFIMLLIISTLLWGTVTWFISELKSAQMKDNEELVKSQEKKTDGAKPQEESEKSQPKGQSSAVQTKKAKSRKL